MADIPVYIATGFLEAGKTRFFLDILADRDFMDGQKTLLIVCEEGELEYPQKLLKEANTTLVTVEEQDTLTPLYFKELQKRYRPERAFIEYNGMWDIEALGRALPKSWPLVQMFTVINADTFDMYLRNMRSLLMSHVKFSDVVIVNRCDANTKKSSIRRAMKAANGRVQVVYENKDGVNDDEVEDDLPYNANAPEITLEDTDFGIFYLDVMENPTKYAGKRINFKAMAYRDKDMPRGFFYAGRYAMTCCEADIQYVGVVVRYAECAKLPNMGFVNISGILTVEANDLYTAPGPVITADAVVPAAKPQDRLVYFT
ncbi:MAG: GTPase [Lachnospiraceae bacterium]|nr:GTPase [Lachnospiraceae bacterium]